MPQRLPCGAEHRLLRCTLPVVEQAWGGKLLAGQGLATASLQETQRSKWCPFDSRKRT